MTGIDFGRAVDTKIWIVIIICCDVYVVISKHQLCMSFTAFQPRCGVTSAILPHTSWYAEAEELSQSSIKEILIWTNVRTWPSPCLTTAEKHQTKSKGQTVWICFLLWWSCIYIQYGYVFCSDEAVFIYSMDMFSALMKLYLYTVWICFLLWWSCIYIQYGYVFCSDEAVFIYSMDMFSALMKLYLYTVWICFLLWWSCIYIQYGYVFCSDEAVFIIHSFKYILVLDPHYYLPPVP